MAGKTVDSTAPGAELHDMSDRVSGRHNQGAHVTVPGPGVGRPARAVSVAKVAAHPDFRDNDGDGGAAGMGPSIAAMHGNGGNGAC